MLFSYTVAEGDSDTDGVAIVANKLTLNGGSIKDAANNDATLSHSAMAAQATHKVDGVKPHFSPNPPKGEALQQRNGRRVAKGGDGSGRIQGRWVRRRPFGSRVETLWPFADVGRARWRGEDAARDTRGPGVMRVCGAVG